MDRILGTIPTFLAAIVITSMIMFAVQHQRAERGEARLQVRDQELSVVSSDLANTEAVLVATRRHLSKVKGVISTMRASRDRRSRHTRPCVYAVRLSAHLFTAWQWERAANVQLERGNHALAARALRAGADATRAADQVLRSSDVHSIPALVRACDRALAGP
jgi:hypothetical protein